MGFLNYNTIIKIGSGVVYNSRWDIKTNRRRSRCWN